MNNQLLFSLIIPTFNRADFLKNTIVSVLAQDYPHFEVIIVDDGSTDHTREVVSSFSDTRIVYLYKINEERGKARNTGMEIANGAYITFLDSDDLLYSNHFSHALSMLKKFNFPHFYRQAYEVRDENGKIIYRKNRVSGNANRFILNGNYFSCIGVFIRKEVTKETRFSEDRSLVPSEDWEYWLRLSVRYKFFYDNAITACMINHSDRSMVKFNESTNRKLISTFMLHLQRDKVFMEKCNFYLNHIRAQLYTLFCLNKVVSGKNDGIIRDLCFAFKLSYKELLKKRTLVILKFYLKNALNS